jgi:hypothetical protein
MLRELLRARRLWIGMAMILAAILIGPIQDYFEGMSSGSSSYAPVYSNPVRSGYQSRGQNSDADDLAGRIEKQIDRVIEAIDEFTDE